MKVLYLILLTTVICSGASTIDCNQGTSDGCSIPLKLPFFYKKEFTEACHRHDQCYFCGAQFNLSRRECDKRFYKNLNAACDDVAKKNPDQKDFCQAVRSTYYLAVRFGGGLEFREEKKDWCTEDWVKQCI